eukprot:Rmarinus@m.17462
MMCALSSEDLSNGHSIVTNNFRCGKRRTFDPDDLSCGLERFPVRLANYKPNDGSEESMNSWTYVSRPIFKVHDLTDSDQDGDDDILPQTYQCTCHTRCDATCDCVAMSGGPHFENGAVLFETNGGTGRIHECHYACSCSGQCGNRCVETSEGRLQSPLEVVQTASTGYGVRAAVPLRKGQFISVYAGEILSDEETKLRRKDYENSENTFVLTVNEYFGETSYRLNVDATKYGNVSRFLNHSCEPNASAMPIRISPTSPPFICFFASREIEPGDDLTFSYGSATGTRPCLCGTKSCRGFLPWEPTLAP